MRLDQVVDEESLSGGGEDSEHDEEEDADEEGNAESTGMKQKKQRTGRSTPQKLRLGQSQIRLDAVHERRLELYEH